MRQLLRIYYTFIIPCQRKTGKKSMGYSLLNSAGRSLSYIENNLTARKIYILRIRRTCSPNLHKIGEYAENILRGHRHEKRRDQQPEPSRPEE